MREVVLVEVDPSADVGADDDAVVGAHDGTAAAGDAPPGPPDGRRDGSWARRARWWTAAAASLTLAVVANGLVANHREDARLAALASVSGVLAPLDGPVRELWRSDAQLFTGLAGSDGALFGVENDFASGRVDVVAVDPVTGADLWRFPARPGDPTAAADSALTGFGGAQCAFPGPLLPADRADAGAGPTIACVVTDEVATLTDADFGTTSYPVRSHLLVLDATKGAVVANRPTDVTTAVAWLGADLVTATVDPDGHVRVTRSEGFGPANRWTFTSDETVGTGELMPPSVWVGVVGDLLAIGSNGSSAAAGDAPTGGGSWLLAADGDVVRSLTGQLGSGYGWGINVLAGGTLFAEAAPADDGGASQTRIIDAATGRSFTTAGYPTAGQPDDGSLAGLILMQTESGELVAVDLSTGRPTWSAPNPGGAPVVVLDGRVLRIESDALTSTDGRTGKTIWTTPIEPTDNGSLVTDGLVALLTQREPAGDVNLTAFGLDDGARRWQTPLTSELWLSAINGQLYGWPGQGVVALG